MRRATAFRFLGAFLVLTGFVLLQGMAHAADYSRGTWTAKWQVERHDKDEADSPPDNGAKPGEYRLQLNINQGSHNNFGNSYRIADFKGLTQDAVTGPKTPAHFQLAHDAGTIDFDGFFDRGIGAGQYTFTPNAAYSAEMNKLGYECRDQKQFELAAIDVSLAYAREFKQLGLGQACDKLIEDASSTSIASRW